MTASSWKFPLTVGLGGEANFWIYDYADSWIFKLDKWFGDFKRVYIGDNSDPSASDEVVD